MAFGPKGSTSLHFHNIGVDTITIFYDSKFQNESQMYSLIEGVSMMADLDKDVPQFNLYLASMVPEVDLFRAVAHSWPKKDKNLTFSGVLGKSPKIRDFLQFFKSFDKWRSTPYI